MEIQKFLRVAFTMHASRKNFNPVKLHF